MFVFPTDLRGTDTGGFSFSAPQAVRSRRPLPGDGPKSMDDTRDSFSHTLANAIFLTPLTLLSVPTLEFFSDVLHGRAHRHGWVTE
jgi:hypothetical protein